MAEIPKTLFENINDLVKSLIWPFIILLFFFTYKAELNSIIREVPEKIRNSSKLSFGSFSIEIEKAAKESGNEELGKVITNLSEGGIRKLLTLGSGRYMLVQVDNINKSFGLPNDLDIMSELEEKGLIQFNEPLNKFLSYFDSLKPDEQIMYMGKNGNSSTARSEDYSEKYIQKTLSQDHLTKDDITRIEEFNIELSDLGKKAFDIIVKVISQQINKE